MNGSYLWSWHSVQASVVPSQTVAVVVTRSTTYLVRYSRVGAPFEVDHHVAMKPAGDLLLERGAGQQVAGDLLDGEAVERQVAVEGVDDPFAILPDVAMVVDVIAVGVGIAGQVEPLAAPSARHSGAKPAAGRPAFRKPLGLVVGHKGVDLGDRRRQAGQVEAHPANERGLVGLGRGLEPLPIEPLQDESGRSASLATPDRSPAGSAGRSTCR